MIAPPVYGMAVAQPATTTWQSFSTLEPVSNTSDRKPSTASSRRISMVILWSHSAPNGALEHICLPPRVRTHRPEKFGRTLLLPSIIHDGYETNLEVDGQVLHSRRAGAGHWRLHLDTIFPCTPISRVRLDCCHHRHRTGSTKRSWPQTRYGHCPVVPDRRVGCPHMRARRDMILELPMLRALAAGPAGSGSLVGQIVENGRRGIEPGEDR
jgi:hypothetical protein